nr:MAG TPA_asm: hypothetical protein [Caudoviricetes sp.]
MGWGWVKSETERRTRPRSFHVFVRIQNFKFSL